MFELQAKHRLQNVVSLTTCHC